MAQKWNFIPTHKGGVQQSNAADNFFREDSANMVENLVRENIQNALDARSEKKPVLVRFSITRYGCYVGLSPKGYPFLRVLVKF
jgi:thioredoxin-like negative regulator of GroEL